MAKFQIKLSGAWNDYEAVEDKILKRAFMAGFPNAKYELRGQRYQYDFSNMVQRNLDTGKERKIRSPHKWAAPRKPIVPAGPTMAVNVPEGSAGTTIRVPHPKCPGEFIAVKVPKNAKAGATMLVPVPPAKASSEVAPSAPAGPEAVIDVATPAKPASKKTSAGWSTGAKVTAGVAGAGVVVAGAVLGAEVAEHGVEATMEGIEGAASDAIDAAGDALGDAGDAVGDFAGHAGEALGDAGEAVGDFAEHAGEFFVDAGETFADFVMDLW